MNAPVDGMAGRAWRTLTFPARATAPFVLLFRRAVSGQYWVESVQERPGAGPTIEVSQIEGVQGPRDGAGPLNHRCYRVRIENSHLSPEQLITAFRRDPNRFSPTSYATFVPDPSPDGLAEGKTFEVKLPGPWDGPVLVRTVEPRRIRLETRVGHMEAGWIEFQTAARDSGTTEFSIESFARSGDPIFDALYHQVGIGKHVQTEMWVQVLETAVEVSGGTQQGRINIDTTSYLGAGK